MRIETAMSTMRRRSGRFEQAVEDRSMPREPGLASVPVLGAMPGGGTPAVMIAHDARHRARGGLHLRDVELLPGVRHVDEDARVLAHELGHAPAPRSHD